MLKESTLIKLNNSIKNIRSNKNKYEEKNKQLWRLFNFAFKEDKVLALKWLMYLRDINGLGERDCFRNILKRLCKYYPFIASAFIKYTKIPSYGRWDDLLWLYCNINNQYIKHLIINIVNNQLIKDKKNQEKHKPISLLGKWLYSENTSSCVTRKYATIIRNALGMTSKEYRKLLSSLRSTLNIVESNLSAKKFENIDYNDIPSRANSLYKKSFNRNDNARHSKYVEEALKYKNNIKYNELVDIIQQYSKETSVNETLEIMWKDYYVNNNGNTFVIYNDSPTMKLKINNNICCSDISTAISLYFAERNVGILKNTVFSFSQGINLNNKETLFEKINEITYKNKDKTVDILECYKYILDIAMKKSLDAIPKNILFVTNDFLNVDITALSSVMEQYKENNFVIPKCVIWNLNSNNNNSPMTSITKNVICVHGHSNSIIKLVLKNEFNIFKYLMNNLNLKKYDVINKVVKGQETC